MDDSNLGIRFNLKETSRPESKGKKVESRPESLTDRILLNLEKEPLSKAELAINLGHRGVSGQLNKVVRNLLLEEMIELTIPGEPKSRKQKYKLKSIIKGNQLNKTEMFSDGVLSEFGDDALSKNELAKRRGYKKVFGQLHETVRLLLKEKFIKQTIPETPKSRLQKYLLTAAGLKRRNNKG